MDNQQGHQLACRFSDGESVVFTAPEDVELPQLLRLIERYLRATGYVFSSTSTIDIVEENERERNTR